MSFSGCLISHDLHQNRTSYVPSIRRPYFQRGSLSQPMKVCFRTFWSLQNSACFIRLPLSDWLFNGANRWLPVLAPPAICHSMGPCTVPGHPYHLDLIMSQCNRPPDWLSVINFQITFTASGQAFLNSCLPEIRLIRLVLVSCWCKISGWADWAHHSGPNFSFLYIHLPDKMGICPNFCFHFPTI